MRTGRSLSTAALLAVVFLFTYLAAPYAAAGPSSQVELKWLEWWVNEWGPPNHAKLIADFERANPAIKVTVADTPYPQMAGKLNAAAAGSENYDVFGVEGGWLSGLNKLGYVENLDPWLAKDKAFAGSLTGTALRRLSGKTLSLCLYLIPYQFAYNVDFFAKAQLKPPTGWDEFVQVERRLRDKTANRYGMSMPLSDGGFILTRYFGFRLAQEGGQLIDDTGKVAFNSPQGVAALKWWKDFYNMGLVVPGSLGEDQTQMLEYLAGGQVPTIIDGPFIWSKAKQIDANIKLAYAPPWRARAGGYLWSCSGVGMSAKSPNKEAAWKFLQYLYSRDVSVNMTKTISLPWATKAALESLKGSSDPILKNIPEFANQDAGHNIVYPVLPEAGKLIDAFKIAFQDAVTGKKDPKQSLDEAATVWQAELDKAK
jgi:ABC-type glycerol-3-phosphate transport system substrate-binding protein